MYGHEKKESIPTLKSEVLLIRTKCKKRCVKNWPWGKWAGLPVRKSKCARTKMIGWLGTRARPTACSSEFASPYQSLAAWGSAALRGQWRGCLRSPVTTKGWGLFTHGTLCCWTECAGCPSHHVFEPCLPDSGSAWEFCLNSLEMCFCPCG